MPHFVPPPGAVHPGPHPLPLAMPTAPAPPATLPQWFVLRLCGTTSRPQPRMLGRGPISNIRTIALSGEFAQHVCEHGVVPQRECVTWPCSEEPSPD